MKKAAKRPEPMAQGQEGAFVHAILDKADDDDIRLAFADWLEERGDPRGEFIRVQCALAIMSAADRSRPELVRRERALLAEHDAAWTGSIRDIVTDYEYHRGFIDTVNMGTSKFVSQAARLFELAPIQSLRLTRVGQSVPASAIAARPELARVRHLDLAGMLGADDLQELLGCRQLRHLTSLAMPDWYGAGPAILQALRTRLPARLEQLNLDNTCISTELAQQLADMPALAKVTHLNLSHNPIRGGGAQALASSPHLRKLTSLRLHDCEIGVHASATLVSSLPRLTTLDLRRDRLGDGGVRALTAVPQRHLRELYLGMNNLTASAIQALVEWPGLARLTLLHLYGNEDIGDQGMAELFRSERIAELQYLDLGYTRIRDQALRALAESPHVSKLRYLDLQGSTTTVASITALAQSPVLQSLQHLGLKHATLTDRGAQVLAASPYLSNLLHLDVRGNRLGKAAKKSLQARFGPDACKFG
jgi:uncharacterized protein (TIGR02996 family)